MENIVGLREKKVIIAEQSRAFFHNNVDYCIGTGRMGLALTQEYQEQLKLVQEEIGFRHIRGHGLFCDDMAIYQEYEENGEIRVEYNYTYLDRVMDSYAKVGLKPFLELGFMPGKLASGTQTIFYWKGNTTPPRDYGEWCRMVQALLNHLMERYGADEVVQWPIEVWNEPNLCGFWENADMEEYFKLFHCTFDAIKEVDARFCVGGPAVCGGTDEKWIRAFMEYCHENKIPVDFVTRHHYTIEQPEHEGHYAYSELMKPEDAAAYQKREVGVEALMQTYYPSKLAKKVTPEEYKADNKLSDGRVIDKMVVYKEHDEHRQDVGKYKLYTQVGEQKMSRTMSKEDLNAYFDRVTTPSKLVEKNFGEQLHLASFYNQFKLEEGVKEVRIAKSQQGDWTVSAKLADDRMTSKAVLSWHDKQALFTSKTATKEQLAARYLNTEIKEMSEKVSAKQSFKR